MLEMALTSGILVFMIGTGIVALYVRDLLVSVIMFAAFSFFAVILYLVLRSPDVAFIEAVIGIVVTIFFILCLRETGRRCT